MNGARSGPTWPWLVPTLLLSAAIGAAAIAREAPWEDEFNSLRAVDSLYGYRVIPLYYMWLVGGHVISPEFWFLRAWSFLPWLIGVALVPGLLRGFGATERDTRMATLLIAVNPYLVVECHSIRYYGMFFLASVAAMRALLFLTEGRGGRSARAGAVVLLFTPQGTVYSGAGLLAVMVGYAGWKYRRALMTPRRMVALAAAAAVSVALVVYPLRYVLLNAWRRGLEGLRDGPIMLGYSKGPPDLLALGFQYNQLLGWNYETWLLPHRWVEGVSLAVAAAAVLVFALRVRAAHKPLAIAVVLVPVLVWAAAGVANLIGTRYYLYCAVPLAWMLVASATLLAGRLRGAPRVAVSLLPFLPVVVGVVLSFGVRADSPLDELAIVLRERGVEKLAVRPAWYASTVRNALVRRGSDVRVVVDTNGAPWRFVKDPVYTWPTAGKPIPPIALDDYEEIARFLALKKYYFHGPRQIDRLLRRR